RGGSGLSRRVGAPANVSTGAHLVAALPLRRSAAVVGLSVVSKADGATVRTAGRIAGGPLPPVLPAQVCFAEHEYAGAGGPQGVTDAATAGRATVRHRPNAGAPKKADSYRPLARVAAELRRAAAGAAAQMVRR